MADFVPGLELSRAFYTEVVRPLLDQAFPRLVYAAARIGPGSDVLGFDTPMSTDHDWGPAVTLFLTDADAPLAAMLYEHFRHTLPPVFAGYAVDASRASDDRTGGVPLQSHRVAALPLRQYVWNQLAYDIDMPLMPADWLTIPAQKLREFTSGAVYADSIGTLTTLRTTLHYYPHDVWLYLLASGWQRISQEEHLMPRAGYAGDELGSSIIAARLVRDVMQLCFLIERQYAPYPKWFGSAFRQLDSATTLTPLLRAVQRAETWIERENALCRAYEYLAERHNALNLTEPLPAQVSPFFNRPFMVIWGERFAAALRAQIHDPHVIRIAGRRFIGGIDQWSDSTDIRAAPEWRAILRALYE